ncbi:hypothetical protein RHOFW104T7_08770 [Rhodanobacter thiooxydans]|uniref:Carboxypeptidase regulatory-like domain-containing protein n=1 Tax=Rhodanobacter thiooxydans TaxID=416169 RepID=A0A154QJN2_9GAMM|nr:carboxypeptidase-like regulatory domain-containing protein [Rhodanobacter thiooxydans]EIM02405.1 hypothetical protein UUA_02096 [Rhodanobacter thiooxydans LCS2]KZC24374.1 hypothetical protein RHOFW104T7_08770 [Rhodanobacter thiooxydans]MCW0201327.1 carboxypeptidase-like regulatory domain-containing protein [Rhodanobacter thiooxydans]
MMKKTTTILLAVLVSLGLPACRVDAGNATPRAETGHATGTALDTRGKPIAGAKILLDNRVFYASYIHGSTGEDGSYRIKAQPGAWKAHASIKKAYNGKTYTLELQPDNVDSFDDQGAVRNFVWKLEGRVPDNDYGFYGGFIQLSTDLDFSGDLDHVELTLTPSGPLIDGSPGKTLRLRPGDHYWVDRYQVEDVPLGRYTVEAALKGVAGNRRLRIQDWHAKGEFKAELQLDFIPNPGSGRNNSASIVIGD